MLRVRAVDITLGFFEELISVPELVINGRPRFQYRVRRVRLILRGSCL
jgi:hypothetical protein